MTKQPTRERERQQWQARQELHRAYGLIQGALVGLEWCGKEANQDGLKHVLSEVANILKKQARIDDKLGE